MAAMKYLLLAGNVAGSLGIVLLFVAVVTPAWSVQGINEVGPFHLDIGKVLFTIIGDIIWVVEVHSMYFSSFTLGYSFTLSIFGSIFIVIGVGLAFTGAAMNGNDIEKQITYERILSTVP